MSIYGDARAATEDEVAERVAGGGSGIYLGHYYDAERSKAGGRIIYRGDRHLLMFGPSGSGKTMRFLVPSLLLGLEEQSAIVIDPKGDVAALTAEHRIKLGHEVKILNPFNVRGFGSCGFNPMASLDTGSATFYDDAAGLAEALIKVEGSEPHWSESAQGLISALVMWAKLTHGSSANLEIVRTMLTEAEATEEFELADGKTRSRLVGGLRFTAAKMVDQGGDEVASLAGRFASDTDEIRSIQSTADTQTRWMLSKPMREDLAKNGIDFASLKQRPTTVYIILPAERLRTHSVWLRLVIVSALRSLYQKGGRRTVMLIDEMPALGHLAPLEDAFGLVRGYNIQIAGIVQDLNQLKALYKERWETFIANAGAVMGFAPNDLTTSEWMSKRSGQTTVVAKGHNANSGQSVGQQISSNFGSGISDQQVARSLLLPHELIGLEEGMGVLWLPGAHTTRTFLPYWEKIAQCRERVSRSA